MKQSLKPSFEGVSVDTILPPAEQAALATVKTGNSLSEPVDSRTMGETPEQMKVKVIFPGGQQITAIQGLGVPLGAEKPLLEPRIKAKEED